MCFFYKRVNILYSMKNVICKLVDKPNSQIFSLYYLICVIIFRACHQSQPPLHKGYCMAPMVRERKEHRCKENMCKTKGLLFVWLLLGRFFLGVAAFASPFFIQGMVGVAKVTEQ